MKRPDIVLFMLDQIGARWLESPCETVVPTPHLDRTAEWRYTRYPGGTGEQLFHLAEDPDAQRNLAGDPAHAAVRNELRDRLLDLVILQDYPHTGRDLFALGVH